MLTALSPATVVADANSPGLDKIAFERPTDEARFDCRSTYSRSIIVDKSGTYVHVLNANAETISEYATGSGTTPSRVATSH